MVKLLYETRKGAENMADDNYEIETDDVTSGRKKDGKSKRMRNLAQYKNLSDDEFTAVMENRSLTMGKSKDFEERIVNKLNEFEKDYDLSDMKINDMDSLRALIQMQITLEDYEQFQYTLRSQGISENTIFTLEKLQKAMSDIRTDISKIQNDLNITRKVRKSDQDVSVLAYITSLKDKAKRFYESKMSYIFCPKCNMLLGTIWTMYPDNERNKIALVCGRVLPDGSKCGEKVVIGTKDLLNSRGTNKKEITPESFL
jgi:hypothetical protein